MTDGSAAPNADPQEVERYQALARTWWDDQGPMWPLHRLNALRVPFIVEHACRHFGRDPESARPLEGLRALDVGCGAGLLSEAMARAGATVTGVEIAERSVSIAREHAERSGLDIRYEQGSVESLDASEAHDLVLNMEVVEHVPDLGAFVGEASRRIAPGGLTVLSTINRNPLSWLVAIVGAEYVLGWLPKGTHQWRRFVKPTELAALLERDGLELVDRKGVRVNPLTRAFTLTDFLGVNYMLVARRPATP